MVLAAKSVHNLSFSYFQAESKSFSQPCSFLINFFCSEYFWRGIFQFFYRQNKHKCFSGHFSSEYMNWPNRFVYYPTVLFLLSCPSPACVLQLLLLVCFPYLLHSRQVILDLYFQVTFGDKLWVVCSRSTDTIAFTALSITLNFLTLFKGEKVILLGMTSCPSAEPVNWILYATTFLFAAALCYLYEKDAERGLCASPWL